MRVTSLVDDVSSGKGAKSEHGLSFFIETEKHKILFDMGASGLFAENAGKLGIDLSEADVAVISHGHYDHGGGLKRFLELNRKAKVFIRRCAFGEFFSYAAEDEKNYIGLDKSLLESERLVFTDGYLKIDGELELFSDVKKREFFSQSNKRLFANSNSGFVCDCFSHEQNLIVSERDKTALFAGCAHCGIVNITDKFAELKNCEPDFVFGGFHLCNPRTGVCENEDFVNSLADELLKSRAEFFTCHCTGEMPYKILKQKMKNKINYFSAGSRAEI